MPRPTGNKKNQESNSRKTTKNLTEQDLDIAVDDIQDEVSDDSTKRNIKRSKTKLSSIKKSKRVEQEDINAYEDEDELPDINPLDLDQEPYPVDDNDNDIGNGQSDTAEHHRIIGTRTNNVHQNQD